MAGYYFTLHFFKIQILEENSPEGLCIATFISREWPYWEVVEPGGRASGRKLGLGATSLDRTREPRPFHFSCLCSVLCLYHDFCFARPWDRQLWPEMAEASSPTKPFLLSGWTPSGVFSQSQEAGTHTLLMPLSLLVFIYVFPLINRSFSLWTHFTKCAHGSLLIGVCLLF